MDRSQILLIGLPIFLFCSDVINIFSSAPPLPPPLPTQKSLNPNANLRHSQQSQPSPLQFPTQKSNSIGGGGVSGLGFGNTININFCVSCSYRGTAMTMKNMLEAEFPGINVILANHPAALPKQILSKVVPVVQFGVIGVIMVGEHIFPKLGFATPPQWYYSLRANRFGSIASTWLFGNFLQSFLQSSGAFEVFCNGELVFSKLLDNRFPVEIELRDLVSKKLGTSRIGRGNVVSDPTNHLRTHSKFNFR